MGYDLALVDRMSRVLDELAPPGLTAKEMFGGVGFMVRGNMACGVHHDHLIARVGPDHYDVALAQEGARPFDITGRPMRGWVMVDGSASASEEALRFWVGLGVTFASSLPAK